MASFVVPQNGDDAIAEHVAQIVEDFQGLRNIPLSASGINDAAAYALTLKNAGTGSKGLIIYAADGVTVLLQVDSNGVVASASGGAAAAIVTTAAGSVTAAMLAANVRPCARAYNNAAIGITSGVATILALNSERYDTDTCHDTVTNNSRLTCKTAGKYRISAQIEWAAAAGTYRHLGIWLNGSSYIAYDQRSPSGSATAQSISSTWDMALNDYVEMRVLHDAAGTVNITAGNGSPELMFERVA